VFVVRIPMGTNVNPRFFFAGLLLLLLFRWSKGGFEEASEGGWLAGRVNPRDSSPVTQLSPPAAAAGAKQQQTVLPVLQVSHSVIALGWHC
jgi:hypothetical protein